MSEYIPKDKHVVEDLDGERYVPSFRGSSFAPLAGSASGLISRLASKIEDVCRKQKSIPGEPCGGVKYGSPYDCKNPRHTEYFELTVELERLRGLMARAKRLPNV